MWSIRWELEDDARGITLWISYTLPARGCEIRPVLTCYPGDQRYRHRLLLDLTKSTTTARRIHRGSSEACVPAQCPQPNAYHLRQNRFAADAQEAT